MSRVDTADVSSPLPLSRGHPHSLIALRNRDSVAALHCFTSYDIMSSENNTGSYSLSSIPLWVEESKTGGGSCLSE